MSRACSYVESKTCNNCWEGGYNDVPEVRINPCPYYKEDEKNLDIEKTAKHNDLQQLRNTIFAAREAANVTRYHTTPHHGTDTVGQHQFNVAMLIFTLCPADTFTQQMFIYALTHDMAERWTGDIPYPAKQMNPALKSASDAAEQSILKAMGLNLHLSPEELEWVKSCDTLDAYLWTCDQLMLGNQHVHEIHEHTRTFLISPDRPKEILEFMMGVDQSDPLIWRRTTSFFNGAV